MIAEKVSLKSLGLPTSTYDVLAREAIHLVYALRTNFNSISVRIKGVRRRLLPARWTLRVQFVIESGRDLCDAAHNSKHG